jgi:hypothetical protein
MKDDNLDKEMGGWLQSQRRDILLNHNGDDHESRRQDKGPFNQVVHHTNL